MSQFENSAEREYNPHMSSTAKSKADEIMPAAIGYIVILAVTILGFQSFETGYQKITGITLLVIFTVLFTLMPGRGNQTMEMHLYMGHFDGHRGCFDWSCNPTGGSSRCCFLCSVQLR